MDIHQIDNKIHSFMQFLHADEQHEITSEISMFFNDQQATGRREIIYDRGLLLLMSDGKPLRSLPLPSENDRIVNFDGSTVVEINPYAYIDDTAIEMKGGDSKKRRRSGSKSGTSSNNNNNNNNNNG